jgi:hypothetical protein
MRAQRFQPGRSATASGSSDEPCLRSDAVELRPPSFLDTSLELLRTHARLCGTEASNPVANPTASTFTEVRTVPAASDRQQIKGQP